MMRREAEPIEEPHIVVDSATGDVGGAMERILLELERARA